MARPRRTPWFAVDVDIRKDDRLIDLPSDTARYGYVVGILAEARLTDPRGVFASRTQMVEALGRFARYIPQYLAVGLLETGGGMCPDCRAAFGKQKPGSIVVHNWVGKQTDPRHAERQAAYESRRKPRESDAQSDGESDAQSDAITDDSVYARAPDVTLTETETEVQKQGKPSSRGRATRQPAAAAAKPKQPDAARAGIPHLEIDPDDDRYPVAQLLATRFGWTTCSGAEWDDWWEEVDNEYPSGTAKGRDPKAGWSWLAGQLRAVPRDVRDPKRWFFEQRQRVKAERSAREDARIAEHEATKDAELHPSIAARGLPGAKANGHAPPQRMSRDEERAYLRGIEGSLEDEHFQALLERRGWTLEELHAEAEDDVDFDPPQTKAAP